MKSVKNPSTKLKPKCIMTEEEKRELVDKIFKDGFEFTRYEDEILYSSSSFSEQGLQSYSNETDLFIIEAGIRTYDDTKDCWTISKLTDKETNKEIYVRFNGNYRDGYSFVFWTNWEVITSDEWNNIYK